MSVAGWFGGEFVPGWRTLTLMILPIAVALALLAFRPGGLRALSHLRLRGLALIWTAAAVQFLRVTDQSWATAFLEYRGGALPVALMWVLAVMFVAVNFSPLPWRMRVGFGALAVGFTLNTLVIVLNGGMPFSAQAARWAGLPEQVIAEAGTRYQQTSAETSFAALGDVVPVPLLQKVVSVGDLLMFVGISWLLIALAWRGAGSEPLRRASAGSLPIVRPMPSRS
jgi:hypothetical protein